MTVTTPKGHVVANEEIVTCRPCQRQPKSDPFAAGEN
jgi:hypothetical protein